MIDSITQSLLKKGWEKKLELENIQDFNVNDMVTKTN
jgi:hypothetical protein